MHSPDDFEYAIENTQVVKSPEKRIETFGHTVFHFHFISELMDSVDKVRIRDGKIHTQKPEILTADKMNQLLLDGFGEKAEEFADSMHNQLRQMAILKYGFSIRKTDVVENIVRDPMEAVIDRVKLQAEESNDPMCAVITGVDDAWEVCLLKFTIDMIQRSAGGNIEDFRGRGII